VFAQVAIDSAPGDFGLDLAKPLIEGLDAALFEFRVCQTTAKILMFDVGAMKRSACG